MVPESLRAQGARRDAVLARIVEVLRADERIAGSWLSGSFGSGEQDEWSDLDLHVAVEDEHFRDVLDGRAELYARVGEPLLIQPEFVPSDNYSLGGAHYQLVYFEGPVHVDWNLGPASRASKPLGHVLLF